MNSYRTTFANGNSINKKDAEDLATLNVQINAILKESGEEDYIDTGDAVNLLVEAERVSARILWGMP